MMSMCVLSIRRIRRNHRGAMQVRDLELLDYIEKVVLWHAGAGGARGVWELVLCG